MQEYSILVVDDEEDTVELVKIVLEREGYYVFSATNGEEAINLLRNDEIKPNLVLLDILMPKKNGLDVCKWIKNHYDLKNIPVILFTAKAGKKDRTSGEEVGADAYINKPFSTTDLLALIKTHLEKAKKNE